LSPVIPFGLVVVPAVVISAMSTQDVYQANPCLYILAFGMVAAKVTNKLVVSINLSLPKLLKAILYIAVRPCKRIKYTMRQRANGISTLDFLCRYSVCMLTHLVGKLEAETHLKILIAGCTYDQE
jgi:hypothetical protein